METCKCGCSCNEKSLRAEVLTLADLVQVSTGSVVSRTLISAKTGTVTLFAFDQGQGLSEHSAPFDAMVTCLEGETEITISGTPHRLAMGQAIIMPANEPHAVKALTPFKMMLTMIRDI